MHKESFISALSDEVDNAELLVKETWEFGESTKKYFERLAELGHIKNRPEYIEGLISRKREIANAKSLDTTLLNSNLIAEIINYQSPTVKFGLVSSSSAVNVKNFLKLSSLENFFSVVVDNSKVENPKPAADCYIYALDKLGIEANFVLAFEDSISGMTSAKLAGITNILNYPDSNIKQKVELFLNENCLE